MGTFEVVIADPNKSAEESFAELLHNSNRAAVLAFARELNEKMHQADTWVWDNRTTAPAQRILKKSDFLSVLRNHGIEEKEELL